MEVSEPYMKGQSNDSSESRFSWPKQYPRLKYWNIRKICLFSFNLLYRLIQSYLHVRINMAIICKWKNNSTFKFLQKSYKPWRINWYMHKMLTLFCDKLCDIRINSIQKYVENLDERANIILGQLDASSCLVLVTQGK